MATPNQLVNQKNEYVDMPGVDPITLDLFNKPAPAPVNPLAPQLIDPNAAAAMPVPTMQPQPAAMQETIAAPPVQFESTPLNPVEIPEETARIYENRLAEGQAIDDEIIKNNLEKAGLFSKSAAEQKEMLKLEAEAFQAAQVEQQRREKNMDEVIAKGRAMSIDPKRYWNNQGTAGNILSAIAVGIGGFASGLSKGATGNPGLTLLTQAIDNDINAQKSDIDNYWRSVKEQSQLDDTVWNRSLTKQNFMANQRLSGLKLVDLELAGIEAKSANPAVKQKAADLRMGIELRQVEEREKSGIAIALMEKQRREEAAKRQAGMFAAQANLAKDAKERNQMVQQLVTSQISQGVSAEEAMTNALKQTDQLFPQLAKSQFASPGQKYQAIESSAVDIAQNQIRVIKSLPKDKAMASIVKSNPGISPADAEKQYKMLKSISPEEYAKKLLEAGKVTNPYSNTSSQSNGDARVVSDPLDPSKTFRFPTKEAATTYNKESVALFGVANNLDRLKELRTKHGGGFSTILNPDDAQLEKLIVDDLTAKLSSAQAGGILQKADVERIQATLPSASGYGILSDPNKQFDQTKQFVLGKQKALADALGGKAYGSQGTTTNNQAQPKQAADVSKDPFKPYDVLKSPSSPSNSDPFKSYGPTSASGPARKGK